jgi:hypothetical protein
MTQKSQRNRRRRGPKPAAQPAAPASQDRYQKYLPEWMKGPNGAVAPRSARPRRQRQPRPAGGYTPGKMALNDLT